MTDQVEPHIYKKFEILQKLGQGAYGVVWKAIDRKTKQVVALKKVFDAFHNATDAQRTFREVMILQELNGHQNIVRQLNVIKAENNKDQYLVFDYMETDQHAVIRAGILAEIHKTYIIYQILKSLKYLHSGEIIHRDLKPSNVLIDSDCLVKIADFGQARSIASEGDEGDPNMTEYVATRWYRAPEIVLGSNKYSKAVDIWSVGCILGELIIGKAIFPGKSTIGQVELILDLWGKPKPEDIEAQDSESAWNVLNSLNIKQKYTFSQFFKGASKVALDFLKRTLEFNPKKRINIYEAQKHPFVEQFHSEDEEPVCEKIIKICISDAKKLSIKEYQHAQYNDILKKKKEQRKRWQQKYLQQLGIAGDDEKKEEDSKNLAQLKRKETDDELKKQKEAKEREEYLRKKKEQREREYQAQREQQNMQHAYEKERQIEKSTEKQQYRQSHHQHSSSNQGITNQNQRQYIKKTTAEENQKYYKNEQNYEDERVSKEYQKKPIRNGEKRQSDMQPDKYAGYSYGQSRSRPISQQKKVYKK